MDVTIKWIEGARNVPVPPNTKYSCTTYIKDVYVMLSITIEFLDSTNEGKLTFLRPDLVEKADLTNLEFDLMEGANCVGKGRFN